jgi:alkanesulfonate monooxygenase SsuD/methylene tetrahydromethanopterin reductase-like flavin-dependent oxidoreductase (luciferase family)
MEFGVTVLPDPPFSRWLELIQLAESHGFQYAWTYDSHVLWQESIPMLAVAGRETSKIKLGHFVTNPATRDPTVLASAYATLHDLSNGRMAMGVGRGDSAVRYIGRQPMKVAEFEKSLGMVRDFMNGREVTDPSRLTCVVGAPSHVGDDLADAREQVRWFPAMVSNHVMDLIERYGADGSTVPKALTDYVQARKFYDYNEHSRVGAKHGEFVTDEICDRFCVLGNTEQIKAKLRELEAVGVDQFNIYLMTHGQEETLKAYGDDVIPAFAGVAA